MVEQKVVGQRLVFEERLVLHGVVASVDQPGEALRAAPAEYLAQEPSVFRRLTVRDNQGAQATIIEQVTVSQPAR